MPCYVSNNLKVGLVSFQQIFLPQKKQTHALKGTTVRSLVDHSIIIVIQTVRYF